MLNKTPDDTLRRFLVDKVPDYIPHVPDHWLDEHMLSFHIQVSLAILFLMICIPGNFGHLLVFIAYSRYHKLNFVVAKEALHLLEI